MTEAELRRFVEPLPLSGDEIALIAAYQDVAVPLDRLPYSKEFEDLRRHAGVEDSLEARHRI